MDFTLALLPWKILHGVQMKTKEKLGIVIAMSMGILAGIVAIVKTVKLPKLGSPDIYNAADLVIWDITEATVTMIAACIPVLRILVRDLRSTVRYGSDNRMELQNVDTSRRWRATVTVDSKTDPFPTTRKVVDNGDDRSDRSDKSILDGLASQRSDWIIRTAEVEISYHPSRSEDANHSDFGGGGGGAKSV
ncbi:uncharacterized protein DNG_07247 [Cephalotrichum gorgonifer]|uniref:Rhodopsin domain-containing protein n=1 Tax=Cephalotrichum gorgonifer TaxID=2041049 RepID=A0AAE8SY12_9PEZI|nr:uncharacterized protein DNG_07247 [Cephalotrichum gorgonifer]